MKRAQWLMKIRMWTPKGRIDLVPKGKHWCGSKALDRKANQCLNAWRKQELQIIQLLPIYLQLLSCHKLRLPHDFDLLLLWPFCQKPQRSCESKWEHQKVQSCSESPISHWENCKTGLFGNTQHSTANNNFQWAYFEHQPLCALASICHRTITAVGRGLVAWEIRQLRLSVSESE